MKYFYEKLSKDDYKIGYKVKESIYSKKNKNNKIEVIENPLLGKILAINGKIHLIENYEFVFSEMMTHPLMFSHPKPEKVLLISDAERGIIKEVIKHRNVGEIYFISENKEAHEALENNFPMLKLKEISKDSRVKIVFDSGEKYINNFENYFDTIIIDSQNPNFKNKDFLKSAFKSLTKEGMISLFSGHLSKSVKNESKLLKTIFRYPTVIRIPSATQTFSDFGVILSSKKINISEINLRTLVTRFKQFKDAKNLKYYCPEVYLSSLVIPKFYDIK